MVLESLEKKSVEKVVAEDGVSQSVFLTYIKGELDSESACLELPLTILILVSFSILAMKLLRQDQIYALEDAIEFDISQNANFAFAHAYGHDGVVGVRTISDFWSWLQLGFIGLIVQPTWGYSEDYPPAFGDSVFATTGYSKSALPASWLFEDAERKTPQQDEYLRYNKRIGAIRMQQAVAKPSFDQCRVPVSMDRALFEGWLGTPCAPSSVGEVTTEQPETETFDGSARVEWLIPEYDSVDEMKAQIVDMEDGCTLAALLGAGMETCRCKSCRPHGSYGRQPWIDDQTVRLEVAMVLFNPQYGSYSYVGVNVFFNRGGFVRQYLNIMSAWSDLYTSPLDEQTTIYVSFGLWIAALLYVLIGELREAAAVIRSSEERWCAALKHDYVGIWNIIDWVSFIVGVLVIMLYTRMYTATGNVNVLLGGMMGSSIKLPDRSAYEKQSGEFLHAVELMCLCERDFRRSLTIYPCIVMLRLFKSFAAQPRLALVTATLERSSTDMMHFFIVFFSVSFTMIINSVLFFGQDLEEFSEPTRAAHTCFLAMFGDWDWEAMQAIGQEKAGVWLWLFLLITVLILLNMLLAIIMEAYTAEKNKAASSLTLWAQVRDILRRRREFRQGKRVRLNDVMEAFEKEFDGNHKKMFAEKRQLKVNCLIAQVPKMQHKQAERLLQRALDQHRDKSVGETFNQVVTKDLKKQMEHLTAREEATAKNLVVLRNVVEDYHNLDVPGDPEYDFYFAASDGERKIPVIQQELSDAVTDASTDIARALMENVGHIEQAQNAFEAQQDQLHRLISEIQFMVSQQASVVRSLQEAAEAVVAEPGPQ